MSTVKARKHRTNLSDTKKEVKQEIKEVPNSFYSKNKHLIGSLDSGLGDVSRNSKKYLEGFGRSRNI
jgi:hypothetical protein